MGPEGGAAIEELGTAREFPREWRDGTCPADPPTYGTALYPNSKKKKKEQFASVSVLIHISDDNWELHCRLIFIHQYDQTAEGKNVILEAHTYKASTYSSYLWNKMPVHDSGSGGVVHMMDEINFFIYVRVNYRATDINENLPRHLFYTQR